MRKMKKKQIAVLLSAAMLTGTVLAPGQTNTAAAATAAKIRTNKTKVTVAAGKTVAVTVKNTGSKKIKATVSDKKIATAKVVKKKIKIAGKKAGKTKVTLTAKGMKKCEVTGYFERTSLLYRNKREWRCCDSGWSQVNLWKGI